MDQPSASGSGSGRRPGSSGSDSGSGRRPGLDVGRGVTIPEDEIALSFSRSGGPGGQKVNTAATRVQLRFDVAGSAVLSDEQKALVRDRLASRLTTDGVLVLDASEHRTQARNRAAALARLRHLLHEALVPPIPRRPTRRPPAADRRRLEAKRQRSEKKRLREAPRLPPE